MKMKLFVFVGLFVFQLGLIDGFCQWVPMTPQYSTNVLSLAEKGTIIYAGMDDGIVISSDNGTSWETIGLMGRTINSIYVTGISVFAGTDTGAFISTDNGSSWSSAGMVGTSITSFCTVAGQLFAGTKTQGLFTTSDNGINWKSTGLGGYGISALAINGTKIIASTFSGVFISADTGKTWTASNNGLTVTNVGPILVDSGKTYVGTNIGIFTSQDSGMNWVSLNPGWNYGQVTSIARTGGNLVAGMAAGGITCSNDNGVTWKVSNLTSVGNQGGATPVQILCLAGSDSSIFAGATTSGLLPSNTRLSGVFRSTDNGMTWTAQGLDSSRIRTLISNGKYLFQGTEGGGVFRSSDDGSTWIPADVGLVWPAIYSLAVKDSEVFAGTQSDYGGVFRSTDNGNTWTMTALQGRAIYCLAVNDSFLLAGGPAGATYSGGLFISTDGGTSWVQSINRGTLGINSVAIGDTNFFATDLNYQGIFVSTNHGGSWTSQFGGSCIAIVGGNVFVGAISNTIGFRSTDNGMTWSQTLTPGNIYNLAVSHDTIYAATDHGVFASADMGRSWGDVGAGLGHNWFYSIGVADGYLFAGSATGQVWRRPLSQVVIPVLYPPSLVSPKNDSSFFVDSVKCVWNSVAGAAYYMLQVGYDPQFTDIFLEASQIRDTTFEVKGLKPDTKYFWRVTRNDSIGLASWSTVWDFHTGADTISHVRNDLPFTYSLGQNYPNPFNPTTTISYELASFGHVSLKVYDTLGQAVSTLVDEAENPGRYNVKFDGSKLASGIYFYQLRSNGFVSTKKMTVVK